MEQDDPTGSSNTQTDTLSVSDILRAHKATSTWKLFSGNHFVALHHDKGCTTCATYMLHLVRGANAGELVPKPEGIESALNEAWPDIIGHIRHHRQSQLDY